MLAQFTHVPVSALWRERHKSSSSRLGARPDTLWRRIARTLSCIGAAMPAALSRAGRRRWRSACRFSTG